MADVIHELRQAGLLCEDAPATARRDVCTTLATRLDELATAGQMLGAITRAEAASLAEVGDRLRERTERTYPYTR